MVESVFDSEVFNTRLFHPRPNSRNSLYSSAVNVIIEVGADSFQMRWHNNRIFKKIVLLFPGNGETPQDLDNIGSMVESFGISLVVVGYRGYGMGTGVPTLRNIMEDGKIAYQAISAIDNSPMVVVGRSLGIAPAAAVTSIAEPNLKAIVSESGFYTLQGLLDRRGMGLEHKPTQSDQEIFSPVNIMAKAPSLRTLITHGGSDTVVPLDEARWALSVLTDTRRTTMNSFAQSKHGELVGMPEWWKLVASLF